MAMRNPTRREVLHVLGLVAGGSLLGCPPGNGKPPNGNGGNGNGNGGGGVVVRSDVMSGGAGALDSYRTAIDAMKALAPSDPRSWQAQAEIHNDHCPHGNAFFLPWHRAYLQYFEQVIRALSGDAGFALPYWNWTTHPTLPPDFWTGTLNDPTREIGPSDPMPASAVGQPVIDAILGIADFETFGSAFVPSTCTVGCQREGVGYGALEGTPHNIVHGTIGGNMGTFMSPLDPIFWLHHCNVDRLWMEWNKTFANPDGSTPDSNFWRTFAFVDNFVDGAGNPVPSVVVDTLFDTFALGYRYDTQPEAEPEAVAPAPTTAKVVAAVEVENAAAAELGTALTIPVALTSEILERLAPGAEAAGVTTTVRLSLGGIDTPSQPVVVHVYLGGAAAPASTDDPSFVRSFGFFPAVAADDPHAHDKTFLFDVGAKLARLGGAASLPVHVETQPLRAGIEAAGPGVAPKSVKIEIVENAA
jgi:tyrosinase